MRSQPRSGGSISSHPSIEGLEERRLLAADPRLLVLTDIGGDPDDQQSMVRLMTYSNEFQIEGLIASAAGTPGELGTNVVRPDLIRDIVNAYGQVRPNLLLHRNDYPTAQYLLDRVKSGNRLRGTGNIGAGKDTEGSNHIVSVLSSSDTRPLWVVIWGGSTDLGQALWKIKNDPSRTAAQKTSLYKKLRVHAIADQDKVGAWIKANFADVFYIESNAQSGVSYSGVFRGMYQTESDGVNLVSDKSTVTGTWGTTNITTNHGALGAKYPLTATQTPRTTKGIKEGDTPSWFYVLSEAIGLSNASQPTWGGWGGRFAGSGNRYLGTQDAHPSGVNKRQLREKWTVARWRPAFQNDFQARMDWSVKTFSGANHNPVAVLNGNNSRDIVYLTAHSGGKVTLSAAGSSDPDANALSYRWYQYQEADGYSGAVSISSATSRDASFVAPAVTTAQTVHVLLEVKDNGGPSLTSYRRAVITINPAPTSPPPSGPVAWYRMDEGTGSGTADSSGNGLNGALVNGPLWATGRSGKALSFDGVNDHVLVNDAPALDTISGQLTLAAWTYRSAPVAGWSVVASRQLQSSGGEHYALATKDNVWKFIVTTSSGAKTLTGPAAVTGSWKHVAGTYDGATMRLYIGGVLVASTAHSGSIAADSRPLVLGGNQNATGPVSELFKGLLDDVRLYNRALTASEIAALL